MVCFHYKEAASSCTRGGLDIKKNLSIERIVRYGNWLAKEKVESPSLELFKRHVNVALGDMV